MKRTDNQRFLAFGQTLRRFLTEHGSLGRGLYEWFREEVGLEDRYIRRWMRGDNLPSPDSWKRFTNALNRRPRSDEPTFAAALSALESALNRARVDEGARIAELSNSITATAESRERLLSLEIPAVGITPSSRHHFSAQRIPFSGRELELARLIAFREDPRPVLWWLIEGPGGSGKSRLALELCNRSQPDWHAGFCPEWQDLSADDLVESRLPHLIVIDCGFRKLWPGISGNSGQVSDLI